MFVVLVFHDGRNDYLEQTLTTFAAEVAFPEPPYKILIDDMPGGRDVDFLEKIGARFGFNELILNEYNMGSFGSIMKAWSSLPPKTEYIFHLENDFVFHRRLDVNELATVLEEPWICNITLLRQAWYLDEWELGGLFNAHIERFREAVIRDIPVCLHQHYFGHNPGLYRRSFARVIPDTSRSAAGRIQSHELIYRDLLIDEDPDRHFAILGRLTDPPRVLHIGQRRVGQSPSHDHDLSEVDFAGLLPETCIPDSERRILLHSQKALQREIQEVLQPIHIARLRETAALERIIENQNTERAALEKQVEGLRNSRSWKLTAPLRAVYDALFDRRNGRPL